MSVIFTDNIQSATSFFSYSLISLYKESSNSLRYENE